MTEPTFIMYLGAASFGLVAGYIAYRTLVRAKEAAVGDIATVLAAIGGGAVVQLYDARGDLFGVYATALPFGMILYVVLLGWMKSRGNDSVLREISTVLSAPDLSPPSGPSTGGQSPRSPDGKSPE